MSLITKRDQLIKKWLKKAAIDIEESLVNGLEVEKKTKRNDLVTQMDRKIEQDFVRYIKDNFPEDLIVSEEGYGDRVDEKMFNDHTVWFLDPIDGTLNFVLQKENFAIMLAVYEKGIGKQAYIYDVKKEKLYWSIQNKGVYCNDTLLPKMKNTHLEDGLFAPNSLFISYDQILLNGKIMKHAMGARTIGSAGLETIELLKGSTVSYLSFGLKPWDLAPGLMMMEENGGIVAKLDGSAPDLFKQEPTIMGTPAAQQDITNLIK